MADETTAPATPPAAATASHAAPPPAAAPPLPAGVPVAALLDDAAAARRELAEMRAEIKRRDAATEEQKATFAKLQEQIALGERDKAALAAGRKADAIRAAALLAATKAGAVSEAQVVKLVLDELDADDAGNVVAKADPKVSAEAHVAAFLKANPHLARPTTARGAGASPFPAAAPQAGGAPDLGTARGMTDFARSLK
jgi:hypothetical protein